MRFADWYSFFFALFIKDDGLTARTIARTVSVIPSRRSTGEGSTTGANAVLVSPPAKEMPGSRGALGAGTFSELLHIFMLFAPLTTLFAWLYFLPGYPSHAHLLLKVLGAPTVASRGAATWSAAAASIHIAVVQLDRGCTTRLNLLQVL